MVCWLPASSDALLRSSPPPGGAPRHPLHFLLASLVAPLPMALARVGGTAEGRNPVAVTPASHGGSTIVPPNPIRSEVTRAPPLPDRSFLLSIRRRRSFRL